jgi:L-asparaginase
MKKRARVLLIALGGTISAAPDKVGRSFPARAAADLLSSVSDAAGIADVTAADVKQVPSRAVTPADMCVVAHKIRDGVAEGYDGVVVTHGTDTMEETAYALALQLEVNIPIVLTGSMRPAHEPGADGPANLIRALRVATTPAAGKLGPIIVMQDEIHLARWATKVHTSRVAAFSSPGLGPVGHVVEGKVHLHACYASRDYLGMPDRLDKRVEIIWVSAGADGLLVDAAATVAQGLVVAGTGGGHVPPQMTGSLQSAVEHGLPIVLASRCIDGPILEGTYGGVGSETHLRSIGLHSAGVLAPIKARLRLLTALALGKGAAEVFPA